MVPPAALCIHSLHRPSLRCLQRVQPADDEADPVSRRLAPADWKLTELRRDFFDLRHLCPWHLLSLVRPLGGGRRAAAGDVGSSALLGWRLLRLGHRRLCPQYLDHLFRLRCDRRHCARHLGYISPVSTLIQMVSRPPRHGNRHERSWVSGGGAFIASPLSVWLMELVLDPDPHRRGRNLHRHGAIYFCFMVVSAMPMAADSGTRAGSLAGYVEPA